jgi:hypothetical protein
MKKSRARGGGGAWVTYRGGRRCQKWLVEGGGRRLGIEERGAWEE